MRTCNKYRIIDDAKAICNRFVSRISRVVMLRMLEIFMFHINQYRGDFPRKLWLKFCWAVALGPYENTILITGPMNSKISLNGSLAGTGHLICTDFHLLSCHLVVRVRDDTIFMRLVTTGHRVRPLAISRPTSWSRFIGWVSWKANVTWKFEIRKRQMGYDHRYTNY